MSCCVMALSAAPGWRDMGEGEQQVEDEFTCPSVLRGALLDQKTSVERVFRVILRIGGDEDSYPSQDGQIWLHLRGRKQDVEAAKLFVKGIVNQEAQKEVQYPEGLHCVFCGAKGLFIDCLMSITSAHILVGSMGCLLISGLAEPVVKAYSLIMDLVEKYKNRQILCAETGSDSLDSRRAFKSLVERLEDSHTLDLLALPVLVKEYLLDLLRQSGVDPGILNSSDDGRTSTVTRTPPFHQSSAVHLEPNGTYPPHTPQPGFFSKSLSHATKGDQTRGELGIGTEFLDAFLRCLVENEGQRPPAEGVERNNQKRELQKWHRSASPNREEGRDPEQLEERLLTTGSKQEYEHLLKFFTAMGYDEDVVCKVLARTGPREASQLLDIIQQEQDKSGIQPQLSHAEVPDQEALPLRIPGAKEDSFTAVGYEDVSRVLIHTRPREPSQVIDLIQQEEGKFRIQTECSNTEVSDQEPLPGTTSEATIDINGPTEVKEEDFTAMGYDIDVVRRVQTRTGLREASQLLDLIQQEQDKSRIQAGCSNADISDQEALLGTATKASIGVTGALEAKEDDFVLGVVKKAAASCGYTEDNVTEIYSSHSDLKPHELILKLQNVGIKDPEDKKDNVTKRSDAANEHQKKAPAVTKMKKREKRNEEVQGKSEASKREKTENREKTKKKEAVQMGRGECTIMSPHEEQHITEQNTVDWVSTPGVPLPSQNHPLHTLPLSVRGPPQPTYPTPLYPKVLEQQIPFIKTSHKQGHSPGKTVTGMQRFHEGLEKPFILELNDDPGDSGLRQIIIDGSNVAMSHGLGMFFSCRGIALAVQYFWSRGHRKISVFVPQWRQKRDSKIKEQHFMTELQDLGLLSYTPSREFLKQRINSYDDRIMLQLAQQTDGVIVTNDNMRDLVDESVVWREIIRKRLLQYLFAGDLFMVPDDPLGRSGPHLNDFLRSQSSPTVPGCHSFAGAASSFSLPTPQPRAHTEVLQYRERTPGSPARTHKSGKNKSHGEKEVERSVEETSRLKLILLQIFPGQESVVLMTLQYYPTLHDINQLSGLILEQQVDTGE